MKRKKLTSILLICVITMGLFSACAGDEPIAPTLDDIDTQLVTESLVLAEGRLLPREYSYLSFLSGGEIAQILVEEGDQVRQGDLLALLVGEEQLEAALSAAEFEMQSAQQALEDLYENADLNAALAWRNLNDAKEAMIEAEKAWQEFENSDYQDDLDDAEIEVTERLQDLEDAREDFEDYQNLDEDNPTRERYQDDLDDAEDDHDEAVWERDLLLLEAEREEAALENAQANLEKNEQDYADLKDGPDPDVLALTESRLINAETQVLAAESAFENLELRAPYDGQVIEVNYVENESVSPGAVVMLLADVTDWVIETTDLTELEVVRIAAGQTVRIQPDALSELELSGEVEKISETYQERLGDIIYVVSIELAEAPPKELRWGMTVQVIFEEEE